MQMKNINYHIMGTCGAVVFIGEMFLPSISIGNMAYGAVLIYLANKWKNEK